MWLIHCGLNQAVWQEKEQEVIAGKLLCKPHSCPRDHQVTSLTIWILVSKVNFAILYNSTLPSNYESYSFT